MPKDIHIFGAHEGVWVTHYSAILGLAAALRDGLIQVSFTKRAAEGKDEKMEALFAYLTGPEFRQRVQAIVDAFRAMKADVEKEKLMYARQWAKREKHIAVGAREHQAPYLGMGQISAHA